MSLRFSQGPYNIKNPQKYIGSSPPYCRSSWERTFCMFCDNNESIKKWASEPVKIPYRNPLTGKNTVYLPDFLISYVDKDMKEHTELIEIKPMNQALKERISKHHFNQAQYLRNLAKWEAATQWCQERGIKFRVITENDLFVNTKK